MKTVILKQEELLRRTADDLCTFFREKPHAVVTMAAGRSMLPLWRCLSEAVRTERISLKEVVFFQTAEFLNAAEEKSLRTMLESRLLSETDLKSENCFWLSDYEDNLESYEAAIHAAGGLDLAVLGIGDNAHIGLNEPATPYDSHCRIQKLTLKTREQYAWLFGGAQNAPEYGCTMGIRTLTEARKIMVLCLGEEKAQATFDMLYARNDSVIPAAFLQLPYDVTVYADAGAGKKL